MVLCNNVSPSDAMRNFSVARGHQIERPNYINAIIKHASVEPEPGFVERRERHEPRTNYREHQDRIHISLVRPPRPVEGEHSRFNERHRQESRDRYMNQEDPRTGSIVRQDRRPSFVGRHGPRRDFRQPQEPRDVIHEASRRDSRNRQEPGQNRRDRRSRWQNDNSDDGWRTWVNTRMQN